VSRIIYEERAIVPEKPRQWHQRASVETEDGGTALIVNMPGNDEDIFVRVQSYNDQSKHKLSEVLGKEIRVTVEVL
jgi:hypothetical protein